VCKYNCEILRQRVPSANAPETRISWRSAISSLRTFTFYFQPPIASIAWRPAAMQPSSQSLSHFICLSLSLETKSSAIADKEHDADARRRSMLCYQELPSCDLLAGFSDFYLHLSHLTPSMRGIPSSYRVHIWYGKPRMAGLQSGEGRMMIDLVWAQYINVTDTQTASLQ